MLSVLSKNPEILKFVIVGGFAAVVNFVSRIILSTVYSFRISVIIAYLIGMVTAYFLTKYFVFSPSAHHPVKEFTYFSIVNGIAIIQVWLISIILAEHIFPMLLVSFFPNEIAHFIGISVPVMTSYFGHKYFSFKS